MGWLIAAGVLALLAVMPLGVRARYDAGGFVLKLVAGPVRIPLYPRDRKKPEKKEKKKQPVKAASSAQTASQKPQSGGDIRQFRGIISEALRFLSAFRRKLVVRKLEMKLTLAGDDPCDLACNYGRAWASLGNLMPQLERVFHIKKRNLEVACDFCGERTVIYAYLDVVISLGHLVSLGVVYGIRFLREFLKLRNLRKGGSNI